MRSVCHLTLRNSTNIFYVQITMKWLLSTMNYIWPIYHELCQSIEFPILDLSTKSSSIYFIAITNEIMF